MMPPAIARQMPFARRDVTVDGVHLSIVDQGPRDAPALLFLHGNPTWSYLWRALLAPALAAGHRVIAPDHAGFGLSEKPEDPRYYTLERHVANLRAVAAELDLRDLTLVLHDWGGPVGMGLATEEPERVARIAVCNTTAFAPSRQQAFTPWHAFFGSKLGYQLGVGLNLVERSAMRFGVAKPLPREVREAYDWPMREKGGRVAAGRFAQMVPDGPDHPTARVLRRYEAGYPLLHEKPMAVLWADKDPVMRPGLARRWQKAFPQARVEHVAPEAGHFWQEDAPEPYVAPLLAFART